MQRESFEIYILVIGKHVERTYVEKHMYNVAHLLLPPPLNRLSIASSPADLRSARTKDPVYARRRLVKRLVIFL